MCGREFQEGGDIYVSSVQLLNHVQLFATPCIAARQASLSITNSWSLPKLMSIKLVIPSNHLILSSPLLLPSIFPSIRAFSSESILRIMWPKYWSFGFSISPSNDYSGFISFEEGMKNHSSILAWRIPQTEEPGGLQSMGLQRVRYNWATNTFLLLSLHLICSCFSTFFK